MTAACTAHASSPGPGLPVVLLFLPCFFFFFSVGRVHLLFSITCCFENASRKTSNQFEALTAHKLNLTSKDTKS